MRCVRVLFAGNFGMNRDYGAQGLVLPLMDKLSRRFDAKYTVLVSERLYHENIDFAKEHNFEIVPYPYPLFFLKNKSLAEQIKTNDVIIDADGIEFIGNRNIISRWFHYFAAAHIQGLAEKYGKVYLKSTKSYGPFPHRIYRYFVKKSLNKLPFVFIRGKKNSKLIKKLKLTVPTYTFPDVSLALSASDRTWAKEYLSKLKINTSKQIIGLSPSTVISNDNLFHANRHNSCGSNHIKLCQKIIKYFQSQNKQILLIPHALGDGVNLESCDLALCKKIFIALENKKNVFLLEDTYLDYKQMRAIVGCLNFYISARYHAIASAICMCVPVIALAWHIKYEDLLSLFSNKFPVINCQQQNVDEALALIRERYLNKGWFDDARIKKDMLTINKQIDNSADIMVNEIEKFLRKMSNE